MSCVFCEIVSRLQPATIIYEDDSFLAFLDKYPKTWGHTQVIPKTHYRWVWDEPNVLDHLALVNSLIQHYKQVLNIPTCYQTVWGNQIYHAHIQILPAYQPIHPPSPLDETSAQAIQKQLQYKPC